MACIHELRQDFGTDEARGSSEEYAHDQSPWLLDLQLALKFYHV
jgi:hypothetical protein